MVNRPSNHEENGDISPAGDGVDQLESMSMPERRYFYKRFSAGVLIRCLINKKIVRENATEDDCRKLRESEIETLHYISFIFEVEGSKWQVVLQRSHDCIDEIKKDGSKINDPVYFKMDLAKPATIVNRDKNFRV